MTRGHRPIRMCAVCRQRFEKSLLMRYVRGQEPDGGFTADMGRTQSGRGWYICSSQQCREKFLKLGRPRRKGV